MGIKSRFTIVALWAALVATTTAQDAKCFFPNGHYDDRSAPCNKASVANGGESSCCVKNDPCFEDGTCATFDTNIPYRGSCTDSSWRSGQCAKDVCMDDSLITNVAWIVKCYPRNDTACCLMTDDTCCFGDTFFQYSPGPMIALLDSDDGSNILSTGTAGATAGATATTTVTTTPTSGSNSGASDGSDSGTDPAVIGLGVALAVAVLAGALAVGLLWGKLQTERKMHGGVGTEFNGSSTHGGPLTDYNPGSTVAGSPAPTQHQPVMAAYKPPEHSYQQQDHYPDHSIPPAQSMSPQQLYAETPVELHGNQPERPEMYGQYNQQ